MNPQEDLKNQSSRGCGANAALIPVATAEKPMPKSLAPVLAIALTAVTGCTALCDPGLFSLGSESQNYETIEAPPNYVQGFLDAVK